MKLKYEPQTTGYKSVYKELKDIIRNEINEQINRGKTEECIMMVPKKLKNILVTNS